MGIWEREKKYLIMLAKHLVFAVQVLHFTEYDFYELHADVLWLTSFNGEMVIYAFLLWFCSHSS